MHARRRMRWMLLLLATPVLGIGALQAQEPPKRKSSFSPVVPQEDFASVMRRMSAAKAEIMARQKALLSERYDFGDRPSGDATMFHSAHLVGDIRPQEFRRRIDTPSLRGVNIQRLFGSQRSLKSVEDFTEFEQRAAYFDGDPVIATKKGVNALERGSQVHDMAEFQELLDFPPAPKLGLNGKLDPRLASEAEMRGQKESPPYLNDGRLLTLDDTVEFFNLVLETHLTAQEKKDLVAFLKGALALCPACGVRRA